MLGSEPLVLAEQAAEFSPLWACPRCALGVNPQVMCTWLVHLPVTFRLPVNSSGPWVTGSSGLGVSGTSLPPGERALGTSLLYSAGLSVLIYKSLLLSDNQKSPPFFLKSCIFSQKVLPCALSSIHVCVHVIMCPRTYQLNDLASIPPNHQAKWKLREGVSFFILWLCQRSLVMRGLGDHTACYSTAGSS